MAEINERCDMRELRTVCDVVNVGRGSLWSLYAVVGRGRETGDPPPGALHVYDSTWTAPHVARRGVFGCSRASVASRVASRQKVAVFRSTEHLEFRESSRFLGDFSPFQFLTSCCVQSFVQRMHSSTYKLRSETGIGGAAARTPSASPKWPSSMTRLLRKCAEPWLAVGYETAEQQTWQYEQRQNGLITHSLFCSN